MSIDKLNSITAELDAINPYEPDSSQKAWRLFCSWPSIPVFCVNDFTPGPLYRARWLKKNEFFKTTAELSYPPLNIGKDSGRCNFRDQSVFYCAEEHDTAVSETFDMEEKSIGSSGYITIGKWSLEQALNVAILPKLDNHNRDSEFAKVSGRNLTGG